MLCLEMKLLLYLLLSHIESVDMFHIALILPGTLDYGNGVLELQTEVQTEKKVVALAYPKEERIKVWKLSYVNWEKEELTEATIDAKLKVVQGDSTGNSGKEYYDDRVWIPVNQARLLRSKLGRNNLAEIINESGFKGNAGNSITFPWGERYLVNSWISGVPFAVASSTYVKMTGKTENQLKEWIRKNIPKDSTVSKY